MTPRQERRREGFSLVEVMVAIVILSVGILAMAATTGYVFSQLRSSGRDTERTLALQQVVERLRTLPYDSVVARTSGSAEMIGDFRFWWDVQNPSSNLKQVVIVSEGPGYGSGGWTTTLQDTSVISVFKP